VSSETRGSALISVIIPAYNSGGTIKQCIESILVQEFDAVEVIIVDDGSEPAFAEMLDAIERSMPAIRVIHSENCGVASARNKGLAAATGEYVMFMDDDDQWIGNTGLQIISNQLAESDPDVLLFHYTRPSPQYPLKWPDDHPTPKQTMKHLEALADYLTCTVWDKVFRREFLINQNIRFPQGRRWEDAAFIADVFDHHPTIDYINLVFYAWNRRAGSQSSSAPTDKINQDLEWIIKRWYKSPAPYVKELLAPLYVQLIGDVASQPAARPFAKTRLQSLKRYEDLLKTTTSETRIWNIVYRALGYNVLAAILRQKHRISYSKFAPRKTTRTLNELVGTSTKELGDSSVAFVLPRDIGKPNGGFSIIYDYANYLSQQKYDVYIFYIDPPKQTDNRLKIFLRLSRQLLLRSSYPKWYDLNKNIRVSNVASPLQSKNPPFQWIIATECRTARFVYDSRSASKRIAYFIQGVEDWIMPLPKLISTWQLPFDQIIAVSQWLKGQLEQNGVNSTLVENGVDTSVFYPKIPCRQRQVDSLTIISSNPIKRPDLAISVLNQLAQNSHELKLAAFGVEKRPPGLDQRVLYYENPSRAEIAELYRNAKTYFCTSEFEGFGLPVAEAMASGCAIVSTDIAGVRSFANDVPQYVSLATPDALSNAIKELLADSQSLETRSTKGYERAVSTLSIAGSRSRFASALSLQPATQTLLDATI